MSLKCACCRLLAGGEGNVAEMKWNNEENPEQWNSTQNSEKGEKGDCFVHCGRVGKGSSRSLLIKILLYYIISNILIKCEWLSWSAGDEMQLNICSGQSWPYWHAELQSFSQLCQSMLCICSELEGEVAWHRWHHHHHCVQAALFLLNYRNYQIRPIRE